MSGSREGGKQSGRKRSGEASSDNNSVDNCMKAIDDEHGVSLFFIVEGSFVAVFVEITKDIIYGKTGEQSDKNERNNRKKGEFAFFERFGE